MTVEGGFDEGREGVDGWRGGFGGGVAVSGLVYLVGAFSLDIE